MKLDLAGRVALVAGGGRGLGRAIALTLAAEGADVAVVSRTGSELQATADEIGALGRRALGLQADLTDAELLDQVFDEVRNELGAPTLLVLNAAALWRPAKLHNIDADDAAAMLSVDLGSALALCHRALPGMLAARHGRIVAVGSVAARTGVAGGTLYATAKAALEGLCRGIAVDYSRHGITANVASVGFAETERLAERLAGNPEARERLVRATALRRIPSASEIADVVAFLCSARASAITGAVVDVTGGAHLNNLW
jgi:3-oxoacyl-[acyl-carrier protein] reductase